MPLRCALAKAGAHMVAVARTQGGLEELDDEIRKDGGSATLVPLNLTDFDGIARLGAALHERHGKLDILVGNAGVAGPSSPLGHIELKPWNDVMAVNVTANFQLIRCMEPLLRQSDAGRAVFVTSGAASKANAYLGPYAASKAALETLVRVWANETAIDADPRQPVRSRADPHPDARHRVSRRRSDDAATRRNRSRNSSCRCARRPGARPASSTTTRRRNGDELSSIPAPCRQLIFSLDQPSASSRS